MTAGNALHGMDRKLTRDIPQVVWFKRDLRVIDHAPLCHAAANGPVVALYIVEPQMWHQPDSSRRHWHFIHDSLRDLDRALCSKGGALTVRIGDAVQVFEDLRQRFGRFALLSHEETGNAWSFVRDKRVGRWCREHGILWQEFPSHGVVRRLSDRNGWQGLRDDRMAAPMTQEPQRITFAQDVRTAHLPSQNDCMFGRPLSHTVQTGGRTEGQKVLNSFLQKRARRYMQTISKPGVSARHCSRLSAHIAYGTLSVREVVQATLAILSNLQGINDPDAENMRRNLRAFSSRLAWRCHFVQKLEQQPSIETQCMHPLFEGMRQGTVREDYLEAWKTGNTGYPLIDAAMRSLIENGWITFRMRAMLVSFASYHLWLDWRLTAPYLAGLFTDYEPGIHYSQFQMQSGVTGINALRMYNPIKQSMDHDPQGKFLRRYLPELRDIPDAFIHMPWTYQGGQAVRRHPIVDHHRAIAHARQQIAQRRADPAFREASKEVFQKLGSRNRARARKPNPKPGATQLSFDL